MAGPQPDTDTRGKPAVTCMSALQGPLEGQHGDVSETTMAAKGWRQLDKPGGLEGRAVNRGCFCSGEIKE